MIQVIVSHHLQHIHVKIDDVELLGDEVNTLRNQCTNTIIKPLNVPKKRNIGSTM